MVTYPGAPYDGVNVAPGPSNNDPAGYINTGIQFLLGNAVLYDLVGGNINVMPYTTATFNAS